MSQPISISVVTPSYNQGPYIDKALKSIVEQSYPYLEHIVVDAQSTDDTLEILRAQNNPKLVWTSEPDEGQSDGLNKGFQRAKGDYILWLNADDFLWPDTLAAYAKAIEQKPSIDYIYGHTQFVDENDVYLRTVYEIPYNYAYSKHRLYIPPTSGSLFRRTLLVEQPLDKDIHFIMDAEWFLRCGKSLTIHRLNAVSNSFRVTDTNKTGPSIKSGQADERMVAEWRKLQERYDVDRSKSLPNLTARANYYLQKLRFGVGFMQDYLRNS